MGMWWKLSIMQKTVGMPRGVFSARWPVWKFVSHGRYLRRTILILSIYLLLNFRNLWRAISKLSSYRHVGLLFSACWVSEWVWVRINHPWLPDSILKSDPIYNHSQFTISVYILVPRLFPLVEEKPWSELVTWTPRFWGQIEFDLREG